MANFAGRMKQKRSFIWLWTALLAVCLTVLQNWQEQKTVYSQSLPERAESSVITPQQHQHHEATLTDASQLYRVCSSRPQRILPSQGSKTEPSRRSVALPCGNILSNSLISFTTAGAARRRLHSACRPRATTMSSH